MKTIFLMSFFVLLTTAFANVDIGKKTPDFELVAASGKKIKLSDFRGKLVVLEWLNHGCPFVRKHYDSNNMQNLQKKYTEKGVVWLSIISSAEGKQGYSTSAKALEDKSKYQAHSSRILLDTKGTVGQQYEAKTTPHMFVIDQKGILRYEGAIDSIKSTDKEDIKKAENYVAMALDALLEGREVEKAKTKSYGCSIKY